MFAVLGTPKKTCILITVIVKEWPGEVMVVKMTCHKSRIIANLDRACMQVQENEDKPTTEFGMENNFVSIKRSLYNTSVHKDDDGKRQKG